MLNNFAATMSFTLSQDVVEGLNGLGTDITVDLSKKLIANAVKLALYSDANIPSNPEIYASNPAHAKQSEYAVLTVLFLATKHGYDSQKLRNSLEQHHISTVVLEEIVKAYEVNKKDLLMKNLKIGYSLPHVTDAEWKLTCDVKSSAFDRGSGELAYRINLGKYKEKTGERESIVEFACSPEELQSFISKLKEIERHCEKVVVPK